MAGKNLYKYEVDFFRKFLIVGVVAIIVFLGVKIAQFFGIA